MKEYGTCRFCGQKVIVAVGEACTQAEIDEAATRECRCEQARAYNKQVCDAEVCEENIKTVLGEGTAVSQLFISCIPLLQSKTIDKVTVQISAEVKAQLGFTAKGNLLIKKTTTVVQNEET